jgi:hypothetical protein
MATTIITKHSPTAKDPQPSQLERGELAIDLERKNIYTKDASDEVVQLGGRPVKIGSTAPPTPQEGDLWMEVPTAVDQPAMMWVYDGDKWLEHPSGVDGAPGADGNIQDATTQGVVATWDDTAKQWTPEGAVVVDGGKVSVGASSGYGKLAVESSGRNVLSVKTTSDTAFIDFEADGSPNQYSTRIGATASSLDFYTRYGSAGQNLGSPALTIDSSGNAHFSGTVEAGITDQKGFRLQHRTRGGAASIELPGATAQTIGFYLEDGTNRDLIYRGSREEHLFYTGTAGAVQERLKIDTTGNATFSGTVSVSASNSSNSSVGTLSGDPANGQAIFHAHAGGGITAASMKFTARNGSNTLNLLEFERSTGAATFSGTVTVEGNRPVTTTLDLIETLATLRNATKDETTLEGLRDAIGNAVGGLIEKFEAMQNEAVTQDIQEGPVTQEITNED